MHRPARIALALLIIAFCLLALLGVGHHLAEGADWVVDLQDGPEGILGGLLAALITGAVLLCVGVILVVVFAGVSLLLLGVGVLVVTLLVGIAVPFLVPLLAVLVIPGMLIYALYRLARRAGQPVVPSGG